jgi:hypothetical protein
MGADAARRMGTTPTQSPTRGPQEILGVYLIAAITVIVRLGRR